MTTGIKVWNRPMVTEFCKKLCENCDCKPVTCKQYGYSLAFLKKHLKDDWKDVSKVL